MNRPHIIVFFFFHFSHSGSINPNQKRQQHPIQRTRDQGRMKKCHLPMYKKCSPRNKSKGHFTLPPHLRCASHTLNLISTVDIEKWLTVTNKTIYRSATAKCSALWTKASRSTVAAELVESLCGKKLMVPSVMRWNSFHNAVARITEISIPQLTTLCSQLGVRAFSEREYKFLVEYCTVTKPLTKALDRLQGEIK